MTDVLVAYVSPHGSTWEVAEAVAARLREQHVDAEVREIGDVVALDDYRAVVLGAPVYMAHWRREARAFLRRHQHELSQRPLAVFALGPISEKPEDWESARHAVEHELERTPELEPVCVELFGGAIEPSALRFPFNHMPATDRRDWPEIDEWARGLPARLGLELPAHA